MGFRLIDYTIFIFDNLHDTQIYVYEYAIVYFITSYCYALLRRGLDKVSVHFNFTSDTHVYVFVTY